MTNFQRDFEIIAQNADVTVDHNIIFRFRKSQRIENLDIGNLGLEARGYNGLRRNKIDKIGQILDRWDELQTLNYVGVLTVKAIKNAVVAYYYETLDANEKKQFWRDAFVA